MTQGQPAEVFHGATSGQRDPSYPQRTPVEEAAVTTDAVLDRPAVARRTARLLIVDGEAASPRDALVIADRCPPDLVILDVDLGRGDAAGVELVRMLLERHRGVRVLVLTGCRDRDVMLRTIRLGVHGSRGAAPVVTDVMRDDPLPVRGLGAATLTERENQVLRLLAVGMSNRE